MKRHLKPKVETALTYITALLATFIAMVDDIEIKAIPLYLLLAAVIAINVIILKKYGRGE